MAENQNENEKDKDIDPDLEKARKSMGDRMDPDDPEEDDQKDPTPPAKKPESEDEDPEKDITHPDPDKKPDDDKKPEGDDEDEDDAGEDDDPNKKVNRPQSYIPMPKYLSEKRENERILAEKDAKLAEALKQVEDLKVIANQRDGAKKDDDIEAFIEKTGFSRETVEDLLALAEKRLLKPDQIKALDTTSNIVKEAEIEAAYNVEFEKVALPDLKKRFPEMTDEQVEKAKSYLDKVAHTAGFNDKPLDFIIYKHQSEIEKLLTGEPEKEAPKDKKTIEGNHPGMGKNTSISAKDFEGKTDFSALNDMEPAARNLLIKDFSIKTYENFKAWVNEQDKQGTEVMREGKRVLLK